MSIIELPKYVFRGTTIKYKGNKNSIEIPYTCTSTHPVKALWFALECYPKNPETAVIYIAKLERLEDKKTSTNHFADLEDEIAFNIPPLSFYPYCMGYVHIFDFQGILKDFEIDGHNVVRKDNLTRLCAETRPISVNKIESIVALALPVLKK